MTDGTPNQVHPGLEGEPTYLDYNATTPVDPRVAAATVPFLTRWFGNPSSDHPFGATPRAAVEQAREQVAALVGARPDEIVFCGSGSEADALAIRGALLGLAEPDAPTRIITQPTEHPAVLAAARAMHRWLNTELALLPVDRDGLVDPDDLDRVLGKHTTEGRTTIVSVMLANNETGTIQPVAELAEVAHRHGAVVHCDAAQAVGRIDTDVERLGIDLLTVVGHKMYAPKGIAALYVRRGVRIEPLVGGGGQEQGRRAGTEAVASIVALGEAAELARDALTDGETERLEALRDRLHQRLETSLGDRLHLNGSRSRRLPNTLNVAIDGTIGHELLARVPELAASVGSACHSGLHEPSPVLSAMGLASTRALATIRLSIGRWTTPDEIDRAAARILAAAGPG